HSFTASQLHSFTASQLHSFTASQLHSFTASQLHSFTASQLHRMMTLALQCVNVFNPKTAFTFTKQRQSVQNSLNDGSVWFLIPVHKHPINHMKTNRFSSSMCHLNQTSRAIFAWLLNILVIGTF
ncbi:hypothetical protein CYK37_19415, partial [Mesorhizobium loti]